MLTAKQARQLANKQIHDSELIQEYFDIIRIDAIGGSTQGYYSIPRHEATFKELKKQLTKAGFKYKITKDNSLLIKW